MEHELAFPLAPKTKLLQPKVACIGLKLEIGDDVRIVAAATLHLEGAADRQIGIPCWATVVDRVSDSKHMLLVSSFEPCERTLTQGYRLIASDEDVWIHHAPGSHRRFIEYVRRKNVEPPEDPRKTTCKSPLDPCYQHEYELSRDFDDVRGCWRCGIELPSGREVILPTGKGERFKTPKNKKVSFACGHCKRARYCKPECADLDVFVHAQMCSYWKC